MNEFLIYQSEDGRTKLDLRLEDDTVWLNQHQLTELFGKAKGTISEHIKHILEDKELKEVSVVRCFRTTAGEGKQCDVELISEATVRNHRTVPTERARGLARGVGDKHLDVTATCKDFLQVRPESKIAPGATIRKYRIVHHEDQRQTFRYTELGKPDVHVGESR